MDHIIVDDDTVNSDLINYKGQKYPRILFQDESIPKPSIAAGQYANNIFIEDETSLGKRLLVRFRTRGFIPMLELIREHHGKLKQDGTSHFGLNLLYWIASFILYIRFLYLTVHYYFYPFDKYSDEELLSEFSVNTNWKSGLVRSFEWHPSSLRCALALINDLIYVYSADLKRPLNHICCIKNLYQRKVSSMVWHPKRDDILVVASESRLLVWFLQHDLKDFKPDPLKGLIIISTKLKSPITSVVFDSEGNQLVACSPRNSSLLVITFDWTSRTYVARKVVKPFGPQFTRLIPSPDTTRITALTTYYSIAIFERQQWSYRKFRANLDGDLCQTAVWSRPNGRILLFAPRDSSQLFAIIFYDKAEAGDVGGGPDQSTLLLDTRETHFEGVQLGVCIQQIVWDRTATRLAVSFQDKKDLIALYGTCLTPSLQVWPVGTIQAGFTKPTTCLSLHFHDYYADSGSLLTIVWSTGTVSHLPLSTEDSAQLKKEKMNTSIRSLTSLCTSFTPGSPNGGVDSSFLAANSSVLGTPNVSVIAPCSPSINLEPYQIRSPQSFSSPLYTPRRSTLFSTRIKAD